MSSRKLTKKDFEKMLNEKGSALIALYGIDLTGMDNYFEQWKAEYIEAKGRGSEGTVFPEYGTWLRKAYRLNHDIDHPEFNTRYNNWVETYA